MLLEFQNPFVRYKHSRKNCTIILSLYYLLSGRIIIYGRSLDAYTAIQSLLALGIAGSRICLILPPLNYDVTCFNNPEVEKAIHTALQHEGVEMYSGYYLAQWNDGKGGDEVYCASFTSDTKPVKFECSALLCYSRKAVDYEAFKGKNNFMLLWSYIIIQNIPFFPAIFVSKYSNKNKNLSDTCVGLIF